MISSSSNLPEVLAHRIMSVPGESISRHWRELVSNDEDNTGIAVPLEWCLSVFESMLEIMRRDGEIRTIIWVVNIGEAEGISFDNGVVCHNTSVAPEDIAIYCFNGLDFFEIVAEEYRKLVFLEEAPNSIRALYRSWRSQSGAENGWGFSNDVYLWSEAENQSDTAVL